jgi:TDG/mug DNA glycosylase family protein
MSTVLFLLIIIGVLFLINSFEPVVDANCRILILGTMPGVRSLQKQEYYGHERNSFWKIIYTLFDAQISKDYEEKKAFLVRHNIALWDVLRTCSREGSSDSNIKNPIPNDFADLFLQYPNITAIFFNGEPAKKLFYRYVIKTLDLGDRPVFVLPSTSPANTARVEEKYECWKQILTFLA